MAGAARGCIACCPSCAGRVNSGVDHRGGCRGHCRFRHRGVAGPGNAPHDNSEPADPGGVQRACDRQRAQPPGPGRAADRRVRGAGVGPARGLREQARWSLPADADRLLRVQAQVRVVNLMNDRTIHLKVKGLHDAAMRGDAEILLVPAAQLSYFLTATFTLSQWAENWESRQAGTTPVPNVVEGSRHSGGRQGRRSRGYLAAAPCRLARPAGRRLGRHLAVDRGDGGQRLVPDRHPPAPRAQLLDLPAKQHPDAGALALPSPGSPCLGGAFSRRGCRSG